MTPQTPTLPEGEWAVSMQPTHTHRMRRADETIAGRADGLPAMEQAVYKALLTERFQYLIYSADYGIETLDLYGQPISYVCPELERRITEALMCDERITDVTDFVFETPRHGVLHVLFTVHTVFGEIEGQREVAI